MKTKGWDVMSAGMALGIKGDSLRMLSVICSAQRTGTALPFPFLRLQSSLVPSLSLFLRFETQFCNGSTDTGVGGVTSEGSHQITD